MKLKLQFAKTDKAYGRLRRSVAVIVDGKEVSTDEINLVSASVKNTIAKRLAKLYGVDEKDAARQLGLLSAKATEEARKRQQEPPKDTSQLKRISQLVSDALAELKPVWHRKSRTIWFEELQQEIALGSIHALVADGIIDQVAGTREGADLFRDTDHRKRQALFRDACQGVVLRLIKKLKELAEMDVDPTLDADTLRSRLAAWLLKTRRFYSEAGVPVSISYFDWVCKCPVGLTWNRCYGNAIFGRVDKKTNRPEFAIKGDRLVAELQYKVPRRLSADLHSLKFAEIGVTIRLDGKAWRVWVLSPDFLDSIAQAVDKDKKESDE